MVTAVYACDDSYIRQTIVSMASVLEYHERVKLYLVDGGLSLESRDLLTSVMDARGQTVRIIDMEEILPEVLLSRGGRHPAGRDRHPVTIYAKLFLEDAIEEERVLYLDSDTVVNGFLEPLFARDMGNELAAGVLMPYSSGLKERIHAEPGRPYICDGVVLFNMEKWRGMGKSRECAEYIRACGGEPPMLSEGTLNHVCRGMLGVLEPEYNLMPSMLMYTLPQIRKLFRADCYYGEDAAGEMEQARKEPVVIHFMEELYNRPWREPCDHPFRELYRRKWEREFGNSSYENIGISQHTKVTRWLYHSLPFPLYAGLFQFKNRLNGD